MTAVASSRRARMSTRPLLFPVLHRVLDEVQERALDASGSPMTWRSSGTSTATAMWRCSALPMTVAHEARWRHELEVLLREAPAFARLRSSERARAARRGRPCAATAGRWSRGTACASPAGSFQQRLGVALDGRDQRASSLQTFATKSRPDGHEPLEMIALAPRQVTHARLELGGKASSSRGEARRTSSLGPLLDRRRRHPAGGRSAVPVISSGREATRDARKPAKSTAAKTASADAKSKRRRVSATVALIPESGCARRRMITVLTGDGDVVDLLAVSPARGACRPPLRRVDLGSEVGARLDRRCADDRAVLLEERDLGVHDARCAVMRSGWRRPPSAHSIAPLPCSSRR